MVVAAEQGKPKEILKTFLLTQKGMKEARAEVAKLGEDYLKKVEKRDKVYHRAWRHAHDQLVARYSAEDARLTQIWKDEDEDED